MRAVADVADAKVVHLQAPPTRISTLNIHRYGV